MLRAILILAAAIVAFAAPASAQRRMALVIGIGDYANLPPVVRSAGDAQAMQEALIRLGFEAELLLDPNGADLEAGLGRFVTGLQPEDTALVYFSGHSARWPGDYLLLPRDAPAQGAKPDDIRAVGGVGLAVLSEQMRQAGARAQVLLVDACRGDPYAAAGPELAPSACGDAGRQMPEGSFVLFSASAGQKALDRLGEQDQDPNSLFTRVLLRRLGEVRSVVRLARVVRDEVVQSAAAVNYEQRPAYLDELVGRPALLGPREQETASVPRRSEPRPPEAPRRSEPLPPEADRSRPEPLPRPEPPPRRRAEAFQCGAVDPGPPAFDCRYARSPVEVAICRDGRLGSCDRVLNDVFERAQARLGRRARDLRRDEDAWLGERDACILEARSADGLIDCVGRAYDQRIAELDALGSATGSIRVDPSFDCRYARTSVEQAICADPGLAQRDREMASLYREALDRIPGRARAIEAGQTDWRAGRDACTRTRAIEACVRDAYDDRIRELRSLVAGR